MAPRPTERLARFADPSGNLWAYMEASSYLTDPASLRYHRPYEGGLIQHSVGHFLYLVPLVRAILPEFPIPHAALISLGHDLCKVGTYRIEKKNQKRKNPDGSFAVDGRGKAIWDEVDAYERVDTDFPLGHGDASVWRLTEILKRPLPRSVLLAIRWHMGAYQAAPGEEWERMKRAMALEPVVPLTQAADLLDTTHERSLQELSAELVTLLSELGA